MSDNNKLIKNNQIEDIRNVENEQFKRFSIIIHSIRAISIFLIVIFHMSYWFSNIRYHSNVSVLRIFDYGNIGVDLFFFLSGMLLTINILNRGVENHSWSDWYKRRIIRIFPAYWIMSSIIIVSLFITNHYFELSHILVNFSGFQMIPIKNPNFEFIHFIYWYITAILFCYLLFPIMFNAIRKNFKAITIVGIILFVLFIFYFSSFLLISLYISKNLLNFELQIFIFGFFIIKFFVFFFGVVFGYWIGDNNMENLEKIYETKIGITLFIILVVLLLLSFFGYFGKNLLFFMFPVISFVFIPFSLFFFNKFYKINELLTYFGKRSYEIYLVHHFSFLLISYTLFNLFFLPSNPISDLIMIPIFLFLVLIFAHFLNRIADLISQQKKFYPYIIILAISFFLFALISIFIPFYIGFYLSLFIYTSILIILLLNHKRRCVNLKKSQEIHIN
ncbi:MAG: acyltransferase family protein [Promethearchaeota archaeon]